MPKQKEKTQTRNSIASGAAAERDRKAASRAKQKAAETTAASSAASFSPAAASPAAASPGAGIRSLEDEDGYHIGDLLQQTNKSRDDIKTRMAAATVAKKAKAAAKRAAAALPAPGTRRSPACCSVSRRSH